MPRRALGASLMWHSAGTTATGASRSTLGFATWSTALRSRGRERPYGVDGLLTVVTVEGCSYPRGGA
jgi:hypothetical protein